MTARPPLDLQAEARALLKALRETPIRDDDFLVKMIVGNCYSVALELLRQEHPASVSPPSA